MPARLVHTPETAVFPILAGLAHAGVLTEAPTAGEAVNAYVKRALLACGNLAERDWAGVHLSVTQHEHHDEGTLLALHVTAQTPTVVRIAHTQDLLEDVHPLLLPSVLAHASRVTEHMPGIWTPFDAVNYHPATSHRYVSTFDEDWREQAAEHKGVPITDVTLEEAYAYAREQGVLTPDDIRNRLGNAYLDASFKPLSIEELQTLTTPLAGPAGETARQVITALTNLKAATAQLPTTSPTAELVYDDDTSDDQSALFVLTTEPDGEYDLTLEMYDEMIHDAWHSGLDARPAWSHAITHDPDTHQHTRAYLQALGPALDALRAFTHALQGTVECTAV